MPTPTLSIIVPVYKVEAYLPACIDSILSQTFRDFELILVDDGSPDRSGAICDEYARRDSRIHAVHQANAGVSAARNTGLDLMRGQFVTFVDSDDELGTPTTLEENLRILMDDPAVDVVQFPFAYNNGEQILTTPPRKLNKKYDMLSALHRDINTGLCGKIYRKALWQEVRLPMGMSMTEDEYCLIDLLQQTRTLQISDRGQYVYCLHEGSATRSMTPAKWRDVFQTAVKWFRILRETAPQSAFPYRQYIEACKSLCTAQTAYANRMHAQRETQYLQDQRPPIGQAFKSGLTLKDRLWLMLILILGLKNFTTAYVRFVLWRTGKRRDRTIHT